MYRLIDLQKKLGVYIGYWLNDSTFALAFFHDGSCFIDSFSACPASFSPQLLGLLCIRCNGSSSLHSRVFHEEFPVLVLVLSRYERPPFVVQLLPLDVLHSWLFNLFWMRKTNCTPVLVLVFIQYDLLCCFWFSKASKKEVQYI